MGKARCSDFWKVDLKTSSSLLAVLAPGDSREPKLRNRLIGFALWCTSVCAMFVAPLWRLIQGSLHQGYSSHIVLVPLMAAYLIWSRRRQIFATPSFAFNKAGMVVALALALVALFCGIALPPFRSLLFVVSVLGLVIAGFVALFGVVATRRAALPLFLFVFVLPLPDSVLNTIIYFLQARSADLCYWMFSVLGVPVLRSGMVMTVPGVSIQVAAECSGINSSIALLLLMIMFAYETLQSPWRRVLLVLVTIPLSIVKNAIRIVTLTLLATKVDPGFLTGRLHHEGGFVFFLITLLLVFPLWRVLKNKEKLEPALSQDQKVVSSLATTSADHV